MAARLAWASCAPAGNSPPSRDARSATFDAMTDVAELRPGSLAAVVVNPKEASLDYLLAKDLVSTQKSHVLVNIIFTRGVVGIFPQARRQPLGLSRACTRPLATATDATAPRSARAPRWRERSR